MNQTIEPCGCHSWPRPVGRTRYQKAYARFLRGFPSTGTDGVFHDGRGRGACTLRPLTAHRLYKTQAQCLLSEDGNAGCAIAADGTLLGLFNGAERGRGTLVLRAAVERGAHRLTCFDGFLARYHASLGWVETWREPWNPELAPLGWDEYLQGTPAIIHFEHPEGRANWERIREERRAEARAFREAALRAGAMPFGAPANTNAAEVPVGDFIDVEAEDVVAEVAS